jgi:hypothetical protein
MRIKKINNRIHLIAENGNVCTNGETYGSDIALEEGLTGEEYREISESEYERIMAEQEKANEPI